MNIRKTIEINLLTVLLASLALTAGCGSDDAMGPAAPAAPVPMDRVTVSFDQIQVRQACDGGATGEFGYKFYVVVSQNGSEVATYLPNEIVRFSAANNSTYRPARSVSFMVPRDDNTRITVRASLREYDGAVEEFTQGYFVPHANETNGIPWSPTDNFNYDNYSPANMSGVMNLEAGYSASCDVRMIYSLTVEPQEDQ